MSAATIALVQVSPLARVRAILIGSMGNLIEWYDVYAYSAFALYFSGSFFTDSNLDEQQLYVALIFASGFVARPFGGLAIGYFADRFGRRSAMMFSILMMCFGSLMIALTPTAATIGVAAPILLTLARIVQGVSQGGEYGASVTYLAEISEPRHRGLYSGVWYTTLIGGQLCAILVLLILQRVFLTSEQLKDWGWRIPFFIGALLALATLYMRKELVEMKRRLAELERKA